MVYLIDTTFLISRWRRGAKSPEQRFIDEHPNASVAMPWVVKGEFLRGAVVAGHSLPEVRAFLSRYPTLWVTESTLVRYAETYAVLTKRNHLIGPNDLWIAATALECDLPLLTLNIKEFSRVPDLRLAAYEK